MTVRELMKELFECSNLDADVYIYDVSNGERFPIKDVDDDAGWQLDINIESEGEK